MNLALYGVTLLVCLTISACGSSKGSDPAPTPITPTPITQTPAGPTLQSIEFRAPTAAPRFFAAGSTRQVLAIGVFSDGSRQDITASCTGWHSDNPFVQTINSEGLGTIHNSGSATISATCQGVFAAQLVTRDVIPAALWTRSGRGAISSVEMPPYVGRLRITGRSNGQVPTYFAVLSDGLVLFTQPNLLPNVPYDGTHVVRPVSPPPGVPPLPYISVQIYDSRGTTTWTLTEVR
jgi:hypothetical protein